MPPLQAQLTNLQEEMEALKEKNAELSQAVNKHMAAIVLLVLRAPDSSGKVRHACSLVASSRSARHDVLGLRARNSPARRSLVPPSLSHPPTAACPTHQLLSSTTTVQAPGLEEALGGLPPLMDMEESSVKEEDGEGDGCGGGGSSNGSVNGSTEGGHSGNGSEKGSGGASPRSSPVSSLRGTETSESSWGDTVEFSENGEPKVGGSGEFDARGLPRPGPARATLRSLSLTVLTAFTHSPPHNRHSPPASTAEWHDPGRGGDGADGHRPRADAQRPLAVHAAGAQPDSARAQPHAREADARAQEGPDGGDPGPSLTT